MGGVGSQIPAHSGPIIINRNIFQVFTLRHIIASYRVFMPA